MSQDKDNRPWVGWQSAVYMNGRNGQLPLVTTQSRLLREEARKKMDEKAFNFVAHGAGESSTMHANRAAFSTWKVRCQLQTVINFTKFVSNANISLQIDCASCNERASLPGFVY
jgi:hypothetical protein